MKSQDGDGDHMFLDMDETIKEYDDGWMCVNFDENKSNILELKLTKQMNGMMHLVWPTYTF